MFNYMCKVGGVNFFVMLLMGGYSRAWLFADTSHGARASATCYSLVESAKANGLEPYAYLQHVLTHIVTADTVEKLEALLPWNMEAED